MKNNALVSVIVPTFNSQRFLDTCLQSVKDQTYKNIEVIIVDNYSTDSTKEIAVRHEAKIILSRGKRSAARNIGASFAKGEFILSIDSDMELMPNVIQDCVLQGERGFDAITIPEISIGKGFWAGCRALEKACYLGDELIESARFFRKDALADVNGYDNLLEFGEDWDVCLRVKSAGYNSGRVDAVIKHIEGRLNLHSVFLKKYRYGKTVHLYINKHHGEAREQLRILRPAFLRNWSILARDPLHSVGLLLMKTCELLAFKLGQMVSNGARAQ